jgi:transposase InsO family protein
VHHDRGCQYASLAYRKAIERRGAILSMSRKANCWDNSPSESFFATLKKELGSTFISFEAGQFALKKYIDWYNTTRRHSFNSGMSPIKKELAAYTRIAA